MWTKLPFILIFAILLIACNLDTTVNEHPDNKKENKENVQKEKLDKAELDTEVINKEENIVDEGYNLVNDQKYEEAYALIVDYGDLKSDYKNDAKLIKAYAQTEMIIEDYSLSNYHNDYKNQRPADYHNAKKKIADVVKTISPKHAGVAENTYRLRKVQLLEILSQMEISEDKWLELYENPDKVMKEIDQEYPPPNPIAPAIGMTKDEVINSTWGKPIDINKTTTSNSVKEQWVYPNYKYIYFENGIVTTIQE